MNNNTEGQTTTGLTESPNQRYLHDILLENVFTIPASLATGTFRSSRHSRYKVGYSRGRLFVFKLAGAISFVGTAAEAARLRDRGLEREIVEGEILRLREGEWRVEFGDPKKFGSQPIQFVPNNAAAQVPAAFI